MTDAYGLTSTDTVTITVEDIVCGNGVVEAPETCDDGNALDGDCCNSACQFEAPLSECGTSGDGLCDLQDSCDDAGHCVDRVATATVVCREATVACDITERCDGLGACPADAFEPSTTACGNPFDTECSDPDSCDGAGHCLPNDADTATPCGPAATECALQDTCDGEGGCHGNGFVAADTACGDTSDTTCTDLDTCDGEGTCQPNNAPIATACGTPGSACVAQDTCGPDGACHDNGFFPATTPYGDPTTNDCTAADTCDGEGTCATHDAPNGSACGSPGSACVVQDTCEGGACVDHGFVTAGSACGDPSDATCSDPDTCDGAGTCDPNDETADTDGDGTLDCSDDCPLDPDKTTAGVCGCGVADTDGDRDEVPDCHDDCPEDPDKTTVGVCGCGLADVDVDGDQIIDCQDQCIAGSAQSCSPVPFYITVRTATGFGQVRCTYDGTAITCAATNGIADISPVSELTACE